MSRAEGGGGGVTININVGGEGSAPFAAGQSRICPVSLYAQSNGYYYYHTVNCPASMPSADVKSKRQLSIGCYSGNPDCTMSNGGLRVNSGASDGGLDAFLAPSARPLLLPGATLTGDEVYRIEGTEHWVRVFTIESTYAACGQVVTATSRIAQEVRDRPAGAPVLEVIEHAHGSYCYVVQIGKGGAPFDAQTVRPAVR